MGEEGEAKGGYEAKWGGPAPRRILFTINMARAGSAAYFVRLSGLPSSEFIRGASGNTTAYQTTRAPNSSGAALPTRRGGIA